MKDWLKKIKNEIIIDMLKNPFPINTNLKIPDDIDFHVRTNLKKILKEFKSK